MFLLDTENLIVKRTGSITGNSISELIYDSGRNRFIVSNGTKTIMEINPEDLQLSTAFELDVDITGFAFDADSDRFYCLSNEQNTTGTISVVEGSSGNIVETINFNLPPRFGPLGKVKIDSDKSMNISADIESVSMSFNTYTDISSWYVEETGLVKQVSQATCGKTTVELLSIEKMDE